MAKPLIQLKQLVKSFGNLLLFDRLDFSVNEGDHFALVHCVKSFSNNSTHLLMPSCALALANFTKLSSGSALRWIAYASTKIWARILLKTFYTMY